LGDPQEKILAWWEMSDLQPPIKRGNGKSAIYRKKTINIQMSVAMFDYQRTFYRLSFICGFSIARFVYRYINSDRFKGVPVKMGDVSTQILMKSDICEAKWLVRPTFGFETIFLATLCQTIFVPTACPNLLYRLTRNYLMYNLNDLHDFPTWGLSVLKYWRCPSAQDDFRNKASVMFCVKNHGCIANFYINQPLFFEVSQQNPHAQLLWTFPMKHEFCSPGLMG
jgi:hypothetical protein